MVKRIEGNNVICIDAGHGGNDGGTIGCDGTYEKDINLIIAKKLGLKLSSFGYNIVLIRDGDYDLASNNAKNRKREDIQKRVKIINEVNCLLFISIHANSYPSNKVFGFQTFYKKDSEDSKRLATIIQNQVNSDLQNSNRKASFINDKYIIDYTNPPGCLVEVGFLSNERELGLLKSDRYQNQLVASITEGISSFLKTYNNT